MTLSDASATECDLFPSGPADFFHARSTQCRAGVAWRAGYLRWRLAQGASGAELLAETWLALRARHHTALEAMRALIQTHPEALAGASLEREALKNAFETLAGSFSKAALHWTPPKDERARGWSKKRTDEQIQDASRELFARLARWAAAASQARSLDGLATDQALSDATDERKRQARDFLRLLRWLHDPLQSLKEPASREELSERFVFHPSSALNGIVDLLEDPEGFCQEAGARLARRLRQGPMTEETLQTLSRFLLFSGSNTPKARGAWEGFTLAFADQGPLWRDAIVEPIEDPSLFLKLIQRLARPGSGQTIEECFQPSTWARAWDAHARSHPDAKKIQRHLFLTRNAPANPEQERLAIETLNPKQRAKLELQTLSLALPAQASSPSAARLGL